jgi:hypothetical protein
MTTQENYEEVKQVSLEQDETTDITLTPEEQLDEFSDNIIGVVLRNTDLSKQNRQYLFGQLEPSAFRDENHIIYKVLYKFKEVGITPDAQFLQFHLLLNEGTILDSSQYINLSAFAGIDENPVVSYASAVIKRFKRLVQFEDIGLDDFKLLIEKYKALHQVIELDNALTQAKAILHDGLKIGKSEKQGYQESAGFIKSSIARLDAETDKTAGIGFVDASQWDDSDDETAQPQLIGDFGEIDELNKHFGGIYTPNFYSISAPTKGGKSKFTTKLSHNCIIAGTPIVSWAVEGGFKAWLAQLRAVHFNWYYNRNKPIEQRINGVTQDTILYNKFEDEKIKELEQISKEDLFHNPNYGKVVCIDRPFEVETFIDEIETAVQLSGAKLLLIDYIQLIGSSKGKSTSERVGEAYVSLLKYIKKRNLALISPAQYKQEFIDEVSKCKDLSKLELRTSGGESSQIVRTPDINIALYGSDEDYRNHRMTLLSIPSRFASSFAPIKIYADLGTCEFSSIAKTA